MHSLQPLAQDLLEQEVVRLLTVCVGLLNGEVLDGHPPGMKDDARRWFCHVECDDD